MPLLQTVEFQGSRFALLDLTAIHPTGNKYFKLKENLTAARQSGNKTLLSFGGGWSNHIHALAQLGHEQGLRTVGVIRGERPKRFSAMLEDASAYGMTLHFVSRQAYRDKESPKMLADLRQMFGDFHLLPEGGSNHLGVQGAEAIVELVDPDAFDLFVLPVGTGGTLAGIAKALPPGKQVLGISVLKGAQYLEGEIENLAPGLNNWRLDHEGHEGGYGKVSKNLKSFVLAFEEQTSIPIEPVYTGKMLLRLCQLLSGGELKNKRILAIHTGGLQGRRGFDF